MSESLDNVEVMSKADADKKNVRTQNMSNTTRNNLGMRSTTSFE